MSHAMLVDKVMPCNLDTVMFCRPANTPTSIHPSLEIGIPAFISDREDVFQLYFVTVTPIPQVLTAPGKMQVGLLLHSCALALARIIQCCDCCGSCLQPDMCCPHRQLLTQAMFQDAMSGRICRTAHDIH